MPLRLASLYLSLLLLYLLCKLVDFLPFFSVFESEVVELLLDVVIAAVGELIMIEFKGFILVVIVYGLSIVEELTQSLLQLAFPFNQLQKVSLGLEQLLDFPLGLFLFSDQTIFLISALLYALFLSKIEMQKR